MHIKPPYLLFLGDARDALAAKVALGVKQWRPENCLGQLSLAGCNADAGLPEMTVAEARAAGAETLMVGVANRGGVIGPAWIDVLREALEAGMDLAAGLHNRLADVPVLAETAAARGRSLFDVRFPTRKFEVGNGRRRSGKRILSVGTDCSCGKMYTALAMERELRARGVAADFRATGQTGILIDGSGIAIDAVVSDFISGAVEVLTPDADPEHWDCVEGQGSLFHASYAGVTMGLIHGAQPDALVLCHEPTRRHMRGLPEYPLPDLEVCMATNLAAARLTNPTARFVGAALNTSALDDAAAERCLSETEERLGMPCVDPVRTGVARIADMLP